MKTGGSSLITGSLDDFRSTIFPMGAIHYEFNPNCERAVFVASVNSADSGVSQIAQNLFSLDSRVVGAALGFSMSLGVKDLNSFREQIPADAVQGIEECLCDD
jgi:hypothetical protein